MWWKRCKFFKFSRDLTLITWLEKYLVLRGGSFSCQHLTYFGVHGSFARRDTIYLICQVTSQKEVIEGSYVVFLTFFKLYKCYQIAQRTTYANYDWIIMSRSSSLYITTLTSLVAIVIMVLKICFLSHDLARLRDQRVIWPYGSEPLIVSHHPAKFLDHRHFNSGGMMFLVIEGLDFTCSLS